MKKIVGGKVLLAKAKAEAKKQDKKRVKRLNKRHAIKLARTPAVPPAPSSEVPEPEPST
jgi:hypothetical protein